MEKDNKCSNNMRCNKCKFYVKSKLFGNYCSCNAQKKPCELERKQKYHLKRKRKYIKRHEKIQYRYGQIDHGK
jgi:hypothetical protein